MLIWVSNHGLWCYQLKILYYWAPLVPPFNSSTSRLGPWSDSLLKFFSRLIFHPFPSATTSSPRSLSRSSIHVLLGLPGNPGVSSSCSYTTEPRKLPVTTYYFLFYGKKVWTLKVDMRWQIRIIDSNSSHEENNSAAKS